MIPLPPGSGAKGGSVLVGRVDAQGPVGLQLGETVAVGVDRVLGECHVVLDLHLVEILLAFLDLPANGLRVGSVRVLQDVLLAVREGLAFLQAQLGTRVHVRDVVGETCCEAKRRDRQPPHQRSAERLDDGVERRSPDALPVIPRPFGGEIEGIVGHRLLEPGLEGRVRVEGPGREQLSGCLAISDRIVEGRVAQVDGQRDESLHRGPAFFSGTLDGVVAVKLLDAGEGGVHLLRGSRQRGFRKIGDGAVECSRWHRLGEGGGAEQREARCGRRRLACGPQREDERQQAHELSA